MLAISVLSDARPCSKTNIVAEVNGNKLGVVPPDAVATYQWYEHKTANSVEGEWMTFKAAADIDGEEIIKEYIAQGSVGTRLNPKLCSRMAIQL